MSDVLKVALANVMGQAVHMGLKAAAELRIRPLDHGDALKLLPLVAPIPNCAKSVELEVEYETRAGSMASLRFNGALDDALPLKDFIELQLRAAADRALAATDVLTFDPPLPLDGDGAARLTERLTRLVTTSAEVTLTPHEPR